VPGLDVRIALGKVRDEVMASTGSRQRPYVTSSLGGDVIPIAQGENPPLPSPPLADIERAWSHAKDSTNLAVLEVFRLQYGRHDPFYDRLAEARIADLKKEQLAAAAPPPKAPEPAPAFNPRRVAAPLTVAEERALRPKDSFKECAECPEMVVVPAGSFMMGLSAPEIAALKKESPNDPFDNEGPQHRVTFARQFGVGRYEVTFAEWDACVAEGGCRHNPDDAGMGRGRRPVINVSWNDVTQQYLPWLLRQTGRTYGLLTEAEWEYGARAGTTTRYAFGDTIKASQAQFQAGESAIVGSFQPNNFGLYDMHGNVTEWVQDCWVANYNSAPTDGSAQNNGDCLSRDYRNGAVGDTPRCLCSAARGGGLAPATRVGPLGFRVGRTLSSI